MAGESHKSEKERLKALQAQLDEVIELLKCLGKSEDKCCKKLDKILCTIKEDLDVDKKTLRLIKRINCSILVANQLLQQINQNVINIQQTVGQIQSSIISIEIKLSSIQSTIGEINNKIDILLSLECTPINSVPIVITKPGCYKVITELLSLVAGETAITINASNVIIFGGYHSLTVAGSSAARGIFATGRDNIKVCDLQIIGNSNTSVNQGSRGIAISGGKNYLLENVRTQFSNRGISVANVSDLRIKDCLLEDHITDNALSTAIAILGTGKDYQISGTRVSRCNTSFDRNRGLTVQPSGGPISNLQIIGCQFEDAVVFIATFSDVFGIINCLLESNQFNVSNPNYKGWHFLYGAEVGGQPNKNLTLRKNQFTNKDASIFFEPILLFQADGYTIEDTDIFSNSPGNDLDDGLIQTALIHLGNSITTVIDFEGIPEAFAVNGTIKNCKLNGGNPSSNKRQNLGIYVEFGSDSVVIDSCDIRNTGQGNKAPPQDSKLQVKSVVRKHLLTEIDGEVCQLKVVEKIKPEQELLKSAPLIPDQRAAGILVDGAEGVIVKRTTVRKALRTNNVNTIPGSGIIFSGQLQFQTLPAGVPPGEQPLTINVPRSTDCKVIEQTVASANGDVGIFDSGGRNLIADTICENNAVGIFGIGAFSNYYRNRCEGNSSAGILTTGSFRCHLDGNIAVRNAGDGIKNSTGSFTTATNNISGGNGGNQYDNIPAVVQQGNAVVAGLNLQF